jgi:hypothetical protein
MYFVLGMRKKRLISTDVLWIDRSIDRRFHFIPSLLSIQHFPRRDFV